MGIQTAHTTLDYPLYVCDFDPADAGRLVVGGGGGASRTGVGNKLTLIDTSDPDSTTLVSTSETELSKDEDSVASFAAGPRRGHTTVAYGGVNSDVDSLKKGKNEHFRVFGIDTPSASAPAEPTIRELARAPLFTSPAPSSASSLDDTYQRIVRVSAPFPDGQGSTLPQLGACATGLSKTPQIAVFEVTSAAPTAAVVPKSRGVLDLSKDAVDLDVIQTSADQYQLAYCTNHELFLFNVSASNSSSSSSGADTTAVDVPTIPGTPAPVAAVSTAVSTESSQEPYLAYEIAKEDSGVPRPTFRSIRYVTPRFILAVCNLPKRSGAIIIGLRLPDTPVPGSTEQARLNISVKLPRGIAQATGLAVRSLAAPSAPGERLPTGSQFVVAVAGAGTDMSLTLYTLEYQTDGHKTEMLAKLHPFRTIKKVHEQAVTCIALSHFMPPAPSAPSASSTQYLRLASVSVKNTVVVQYIPLREVPAASSPSSSAAEKPSPPRYVVALESIAPSGASYAMFVFGVFVVTSLLAYALLEVLGLTQPLLGAREVVPADWLSPLPGRYASANYDHLAQQAQADAEAEAVPVAAGASYETPDFGAMPEMHPVAAFLASATDAAPAEPEAAASVTDGTPHVLLLRGHDGDHAIEIAPHDEEQHGPAMPWESLDPEQRATWRQKLVQAGHWTEDMGETVFRGVLFGELAGLVGAAMR